MSDSSSISMTYAWNWFSLHSGQRMQLVNFWLVATAFLAAALVQALIEEQRVVATGVAIAGAIASVAFSFLDARTRRLIRMAESMLLVLESRLAAEPGGDPSIRLVNSASGSRVSLFDSYKTIIAGLEWSFAVMFVLAAAYSVV